MDPLQSTPNELKDLYKQHYKTIQTRVTRGRIKYVYHYLMTEQYSRELVENYLSVIRQEHDNGCKINVAFGYILENIESRELRFFHPSNNTMIFDTPRLIQSDPDYKQLLGELERQDVYEYANTQRPSTKWLVVKIVCMRFDVYKIM